MRERNRLGRELGLQTGGPGSERWGNPSPRRWECRGRQAAHSPNETALALVLQGGKKTQEVIERKNKNRRERQREEGRARDKNRARQTERDKKRERVKETLREAGKDREKKRQKKRE